MQTYLYQARTSDGLLICGDVQADRQESAVAALRSQGYYPITLRKAGRLAEVMRTRSHSGGRVTVVEVSMFTHQLATLLKAGLRLSQALRTLSRQTGSRALRSVIGQVHKDVEESKSLSGAMAQHPKVFSQVYCAVIRAAEQSGSLPKTLAALSRQMKMQAAVRARIRGAMIYPMFLLVTSAVVVGVLTTFVVPRFIELFVRSQQRLPLPTQILYGITSFVKSAWWLMLGGLALASVGMGTALREERFRRSIHDLALRMPLIGPFSRKIQLARIARTLGSLLNGGVKIVDALETTQAATDNLAFNQVVAEVKDAVLKGSTLTKAIRGQPYFTEVAANLVEVGEDTGTLGDMLLELAEIYDQECEASLGTFTTLLGPVLIVVLGAIVGFVVLAILLPVFETTTMVR